MNSGLVTSASLLAVLNCANKLNRMIMLIVYAIVNWVAKGIFMTTRVLLCNWKPEN